MHFLEALIEHRLELEDDDRERDFATDQIPRLVALSEVYGGSPHKERVSAIIAHIFADMMD